MEIAVTRSFRRSVERYDNIIVESKLKLVFDDFVNAESIAQISNRVKLKNADNCCRVRIGTYRVGIIVEDNKAVFAAFGHRKDLYTGYL